MIRANYDTPSARRSVAKYAPWVRNIYLLVDGPSPQLPSFVKSQVADSGTTLHVIDRCLLVDRKEDCPTNNSHACYTLGHRIQGVSQLFVLLDDDFVFTNPVTPSYFFNRCRPRYFAYNVSMAWPVSYVSRARYWPPMRVPGRFHKGLLDMANLSPIT